MHPGPRHSPPGASPLHRGSPKFRAEARCPPPASLTAGGCRGTAGGGKPGKKQIVPLGGQGGPGPRSPPAPMPLAVPGSLLANEKAGAAPRCPAFSRGFGAVGFVCPPLGDKLGARAGPRRASAAFPYPRCPWPWGKSRFRSFLVQGEGFLGRCAPRPPALPLAPFPRPGAGAWVRFIFGAAKLFIFIFFSSQGNGLRGEEAEGHGYKTTSGDGLCRGASAQLRGAPRGPPGPSPAAPGPGVRPGGGGCLPGGARSPSEARKKDTCGHPRGTWGHLPAALRGKAKGTSGLSPPARTRAPKSGERGGFKTKPS